jgi:4-hydroxy 2-oxovalerate aldolase
MVNENTTQTERDPWVTFRPEIKVLDCTVRDGGLMNKHQFGDDFVRAAYDTCVAAGVDYMELGYKTSKSLASKDEYGDWKFCDEDDIRRIVSDNPTNLKLTAIADADRTDYHTDFLPRDQSVLDCLRIACYIHQIPLAIDMIQDAHDKGYETTLNLMAASTVQESEICTALEEIANTPVDAIYVVDSFGSMYSEDVRNMVKMYQQAGKDVGVHMHNNQQLAYANTIEGVIAGANWLDATIMGLGRGAGNCALELLLGFLHNPKFHTRPVLQMIQDYMLPLRKEVDWGYNEAYMITGHLNQHPRPAMAMRASDKPEDFVAFWDQMTSSE